MRTRSNAGLESRDLLVGESRSIAARGKQSHLATSFWVLVGHDRKCITFMAHIVMPAGRTVGQHVAPAIEAAYESGKVRALLPEFTS